VTARVKVSLLGRFRVEAGGNPLEMPSKKAQALLAYLAMPPGRRHARAHLAGLLWGDMAEERARHNLRQCVSALRRSLGDAVIAPDGDALYLDPCAVEVDVAVLEAGAAEAVMEAGPGEFLEGLTLREDPFDEWLADQRARLKRLTCDRLGETAAARAAAGAVDDAIELARRQLALDPASEEGHRLLIELYGRCGRPSVAIRQYGVCVEALQRHLGVAPSAETVRLYESLRHRKPHDRAEVCSTSIPDPAEPGPLPDRPSIVVLKFTNLDGSVDQDYFGIGIAEDITTALSRFGSLFVISPITAYALHGRDLSPRQVGRELGVYYVVRGTVRRSAERVRVTVHLVDARTGREVWAHQYDRNFSEIFQVQDEITQTVVATLVGRVEADSLDLARRKAPNSLAAYECFLRGRDHHHRFTLDDNTRAIEMFERAVALDSTYALGYAWLACAIFQRTFFDPDPALPGRCWEEVQKAYALDDGESEVHRILGAFHLMWQEFEKAEFHLQRALALNPNDDRIVCQRGELATYLGRAVEGEQWVRRAMRLNPYYLPRYWLRLAQALYHQGRFEEALDALQREPIPVPHERTYMAAILARLGRTAAACELIRELRMRQPRLTGGDLTRPLPYRHPEDRDDVAAALGLAGLPV
jgi:adenylate cyclase